ncbi:unnamed protein product [Moneuplotes crassus]|uniref:Uncharacterized protein n=1 Tax=Euplotes crassus TaxID=5936 RepID=A0AAD1XUI8_EUPCR|nr:unnamed protein product [Moneuplotes crassus]
MDLGRENDGLKLPELESQNKHSQNYRNKRAKMPAIEVESLNSENSPFKAQHNVESKNRSLKYSKSGPLNIKTSGTFARISTERKPMNTFRGIKIPAKRLRAIICKRTPRRRKIKINKLSEYKHPMGKWAHLAYCSPKPGMNKYLSKIVRNLHKIDKDE